MADNLSTFVKKTIDDEIMENYQHMRQPPCVYAKVVSVSKSGSVYTVTLRLLDKYRQKDQRYTDNPMTKTYVEVQRGDIVACMLMYGDAEPYIVGRCV